MKSVAILTMVYDDDIYLKIWLSYWEKFVPRSNLYVLIHADYGHYEQMASGCNTIRIARPPMHAGSEVSRWKMLSSLASGLTLMFDRVIYTDVDEIIALDPKHGNNPIDYILDRPEPVVSPFGVDLVEPIELDLPAIDLSRPILSQRSFVACNPPYSKPCIISDPVIWGTGGHFINREEIYLSDALVLFHLKLFDKLTYRERAAKRKAMVTDPETGELIMGPGGKEWMRTDEFHEYTIESRQPINNIDFRRPRKKWLESAKFNRRSGVWRRSGRSHKQLHRIPERFDNVF
ncbi:hypothetical protein [Paracoccus sp. MC1862]|uniref:hypothetical protein n=1 Tax=Paracoccus sp. MC1862 TaxID=2760307 RepID=UPI0016007603|nr:hypothetical protein [Paracoccus sp. MC1862]MBB1496819.1 hypothetical protein [Paracoccus sp. MC1862]QQO45448.1 hypothetical protein JGR78_03590 [Paracoccus sp. MC1862]